MTRSQQATSTSSCTRIACDTHLYKSLQEMLSRVNFSFMDFIAHVSTPALELDGRPHNIPRIARARTQPHATRSPERASAGSAMAHSMQHEHTCRPQAQPQPQLQSLLPPSPAAAATATAIAALTQRQQRRDVTTTATATAGTASIRQYPADIQCIRTFPFRPRSAQQTTNI